MEDEVQDGIVGKEMDWMGLRGGEQGKGRCSAGGPQPHIVITAYEAIEMVRMEGVENLE